MLRNLTSFLAGLVFGLGLLLACAADLALLLDGTPAFLAGMGLFGLMQITYLAVFIRLSTTPIHRRWPVPACYLAFWLGANVVLWPHLEALAVPVAVYSLLLVAMAAAAVPADAALFGDDEARKRIVEQQKQINALYQIHQELTERLAKAEEALKNQPVMALASQIEALREDMRQLLQTAQVALDSVEQAAASAGLLVEDNRAAISTFSNQGLRQVGPTVLELRETLRSLKQLSDKLGASDSLLLGRDQPKEYQPR